ncbi:MAG: FUSC family protein [Ferruginibacter sp.]|nr:FUSC family protein [Ferruginibacter sp.]
MNYKKYINFINGRYASEGLRITAGIILPSLVMHYFDMLSLGIVMSVGALCVSVADTPGAVKHRLAGMFSCSLLVAGISVITYYSAANAFLLGAVLFICGFIFSMLTVYGNRSSSVGIAVMLIMVLSLQDPLQGRDIWITAGYTLAGGIWYMLYSLVLYRLRPYHFIQQVLGDYITGVGSFLKLRGSLYATDPDYDKINEQLLQSQVQIEAEQKMLSDLLFNTRAIVKETTHTGRVLVKIYLEVAELYESVMTSYQHYDVMHEQFDATGILQDYHTVINAFAREIDEIGMAVRSGISSETGSETILLVKGARKHFDELRLTHMNENNVEDFVGLGRIMKNLEDLAAKIKLLHGYTGYEISLKTNNIGTAIEAHTETSPDIRPSLFFDNLNFRSNTFRHALRVSLAMLAGYLIAVMFKIDRGYWILLTIVVILKPAYALTKKRNMDRLIGTLAGIIAGMFILYFVKNNNVLLALMVCFMVASYTFMRTNYFLCVLFMTPELLIFFHLLYPGNISELMQDRIIDTAIGSVIAFFASLFLVPAWERHSIRTYMAEMLQANEKYYRTIAWQFTPDAVKDITAIKLARRNVLIVLANLSDAFTRMLSEPKRHRQGIKNVHKFVSVNHTLISHLATLSWYLQTNKVSFRSANLVPWIEATTQYFKTAEQLLTGPNEIIVLPPQPHLGDLQDMINNLLEKRKTELMNGQLETPTKKELVETKSVTDQFNYILSDASAIHKLCMEHDREMKS